MDFSIGHPVLKGAGGLLHRTKTTNGYEFQEFKSSAVNKYRYKLKREKFVVTLS